MKRFDMLRTLSGLLYAQAAPTGAAPGFAPPSADLLAQWADRNFTGIYTASVALASPPFSPAEVMALYTAIVKAANELKGLGVPGAALNYVVPELAVWAVNTVLPPARRPLWLALMLDAETVRRMVKVIYKAVFPPTPALPAPGAGAVIPPASPTLPAPLPGYVAPDVTPAPPAGPIIDPATGKPTA